MGLVVFLRFERMTKTVLAELVGPPPIIAFHEFACGGTNVDELAKGRITLDRVKH